MTIDTTPKRNLRKDEQVCNECGKVFRVTAKNRSAIDPMDPRCANCPVIGETDADDGEEWTDQEIIDAAREEGFGQGQTDEQLLKIAKGDDEPKQSKGKFVCGSCGESRTKSKENPDICGPCWEDAGYENEHSDTAGDHNGNAPEHRCPICRKQVFAEAAMRRDDHFQTDRGTCKCGTFCHTFGRGDDRKLAMHISRMIADAQDRTYTVKYVSTGSITVTASSREEAENIAAIQRSKGSFDTFSEKVIVKLG